MTSNPTNSRIVLSAPLEADELGALRAGQRVLISGTVFTGRDAAHARLIALIEAKEPLPIDLEGAILYYCGPTPAPPGRVIGSAGPTTSSRMDAYAPALHALGVRATIGKGPRSVALQQSLVEHGAVYLAAVGGVGALLGERIKECEVVAFPELGPEAIRRLTVDDFPAIVAYDSVGNSAYA